MHLERAARRAPDVQSLRYVIVNETRRLLPYRQAALAEGAATHTLPPNPASSPVHFRIQFLIFDGSIPVGPFSSPEAPFFKKRFSKNFSA